MILHRPAARHRRRPLGANRLSLVIALLLATVYSHRFWQVVWQASEPAGWRGALFIASTLALVVGLNTLLLSFVAWRGLQKPVLALLLPAAAMAAYFMDNYGAVIDRHAVASVFESDVRESAEWLSWRMAAYFGLLGLLPAILVLRLKVFYRPLPRELLARLGFLAALAAAVALAVWPSSRDIASLVRNHRELRHLLVPMNLYNAVVGYYKHSAPAGPVVIEPLGRDARAGSRGRGEPPRLLVLAIGESARAASFSLYGYPRATNPELARLPLAVFRDVTSCGTNTATSLPCMFSDLGRKAYDETRARSRENLLDVLAHAGYAVEWKDNNTGSKRIAARVIETPMAALAASGSCNEDGCHDRVLVEQLQAALAKPARDEVLVLHMLGSHGPAYHLRYPPEFERFRPACRSNDLQDCTPEQIRNAYDNTIAYTDHVLAQMIALLQADATRRSALLFVSDHGESTGEHGLYLHGAPFLVAPDEQTQVPMLLWSSDSFRQWRGLDGACLSARLGRPLSHDHYFHSVLGLLDVRTAAYRPALDAFGDCLPH